MFDKLVYIPHYDSKHYPFCRSQLYIQPNEPTNQNIIRVPKSCCAQCPPSLPDFIIIPLTFSL